MKLLRNTFLVLAVAVLVSTTGNAQTTPVVITNPAQPNGSIDHIEITYSIILNQGGNAPAGDRVAAVGGYVDFTGAVPYVTISIGGQEYTSPTDTNGNFSFLVFANDNSFTATAWDPITGSSTTRSQNKKAVTRSLN